MFIDFDFKGIFDSDSMCSFKVHTEKAVKFMIDEFDVYCELHTEYRVPHETAKKYRQKVSESKQFTVILS